MKKLQRFKFLSDQSVERRWWQFFVGAATAALTIVASLILLIQPTYDGRLERDFARTTWQLDSITIPREQIGWQQPLAIHVKPLPVYGFVIAPLSDDSPLPRGLERWPQPGEVFVSPGYAALPGALAAASEYGEVSVAIDQSGLVIPDEPYIFVGTSQQTATEQGFSEMLVPAGDVGAHKESFGPGEYNGTTGAPRNYLEPINFYLGLITLVGIPTLIVLIVLINLDGERRRQKILTMRLVGAPRNFVVKAITQEIGGPALAGAAAGFALIATATIGTWREPLSGFMVIGADWRGTLPLIAVCALLCAGIALLAGFGAYARTPRKYLGARPVAGAKKIPVWPLPVVLVLILVCNALISEFSQFKDDPRVLLTYMGITIVLLLFSGTVLAGILKLCAKLGLWISKRRSNPELLIASRALLNLPRPTVRVCMGVVLVSFLTVFSYTLSTRAEPEIAQAQAALEQNGGLVAQLNERLSPQQISVIDSQLDTNVVLIGVDDIDSDESKYRVALGDCDVLETVFGSCSVAPQRLPAHLAQVFSEEVTVTQVSSEDIGQGDTYLAISTNNEPINMLKLRDVIRNVLNKPNVNVPLYGEHEMQYSYMSEHNKQYIFLFGVGGVLISAFAAISSLVFEVLRVAAGLAPLSAITHGRRTHLALCAGVIGLPFCLASATGIVMSLSILAFEFKAGTLILPVSMLITLGVALIGLAILVSAIASHTLNKEANGWRGGS